MADVGFRDLTGSFAPGRRGEPRMMPPSFDVVPQAAEPSPPAIVTPPPPPAPALFGPDPRPVDAFGLEPLFAVLAELMLHRRTGTPLTIGVLGVPGSGRSFALERTLARARDLADAANATANTPFVTAVHIVSVDAASLVDDPATVLASRLHASLGARYPDLAREIGSGARDAHASLAEADAKLDEARRRLDVERRALDDAGSRRARLVETVLYETSGSAVDAFARSNRAALERRLAGFGIGGDAVRSYKDFVIHAAGEGGKLALSLRALWGFKGQARLIVFAVLLAALGIGLGIAAETREGWLAAMRNGAQAGPGISAWVEAHIDWFAQARRACFVLAGLCVLANLWRAFAFLKPVFKGADLLAGDLDSRRRDLDGLYAHQVKRVDGLERDVERLSGAAAEAERRLGGRSEPSLFAPAKGAAAEAVFVGLARASARGEDRIGPGRIVLAIDGLDAVDPRHAREILEEVRRKAGAGMVMLLAVDPARIDDGVLDRCIDVPFRIASPVEPAVLIAQRLGRGTAETALARSNPAASALDETLDDDESQMLADVGPLSGETPRALRRFVDLYRLARAENGGRHDVPHGALAFALALALGGTPAERNDAEQALRSKSGGGELPASATSRLRTAYDAARSFGDIGLADSSLAAAAVRASRFTFRA